MSVLSIFKMQETNGALFLKANTIWSYDSNFSFHNNMRITKIT